jgi:hypothetical protein
MILKKAKELDNGGIGIPSILLVQPFFCDGCKAGENTLVLQIYLGYSEQVFALPFQIFHFSSTE